MRKINLEITDLATLQKRYKKNERYSILIQIGEFSYHFSNKEKARRFLTKYQRYLNDTLNLALSQLPEILNIHIHLLKYTTWLKATKNQDLINDVLTLTNKLYQEENFNENGSMINWIHSIHYKILKLVEHLKAIAKKSRYNQSDYYRLKSIQKLIELSFNEFQETYKNQEYKGVIDLNQTQIIQLYNKSQLTINF